MPPATPETIPELLPIVAIAVLLLVHVPPGTLLLKVIVVPSQNDVVPLMDTAGLIVTTAVVKQPVPVIW